MIRRALRKDLDRLCEIWLSSNLDAHYFVPEKYWRDNLLFVREKLAEAEIYVFEDGVISGFIGLTEVDQNVDREAVFSGCGELWYIAGIFVDNKKRNIGIGKKLLDYVKLKKDCLCLSVYEKNTGAVRFYLREGFEITEEGTDEATGEKELQMRFIKS